MVEVEVGVAAEQEVESEARLASTLRFHIDWVDVISLLT